MNVKELRSEFCKQKGWNFIEFETITQAEEYILFLESKVDNDDIFVKGKLITLQLNNVINELKR